MKTFIYVASVLVVAAVSFSQASFASNEGVGVQTLSPSPSPDAKQFVFAADYNSPTSMLHLWISNVDGTKLQQITTSALVDEEPAWSPDGSAVAFASTASNSSSTDIWSVAPDGSRLTQLTSKSLNNRQPAWSPDGKKIAFISDQSGSNNVWIMNADGSGRTRVTSLSDHADHPSFSPDGKSIVFSENATGSAFSAKLMIVGVDGSNPHAITDGSYPDWNPSWGGQGILFSSRRDSSGHWKIWVIQSDGSGLRQLGNTMALDPVWTQDGRVLYTSEMVSTGALSAPVLLDPISGVTQTVSTVGGFFTPIDIRPNKTPNDINPNSHGNVTVALLSKPGFNPVTAVDQSTLTFGHSGSEASLRHCQPQGQDINGDGVPDLLCKFDISKTGFQRGDVVGILRFKGLDGAPFEGRDSILITDVNDPDDNN